MRPTDCHRPDRVLGFLFATAMLIAVAATAPAQTPQGALASHRGPPQTRNAAIAELLANGFSSVTSLHRTGEIWSGEGVRAAILVDFTIDEKGALQFHPAPH